MDELTAPLRRGRVRGISRTHAPHSSTTPAAPRIVAAVESGLEWARSYRVKLHVTDVATIVFFVLIAFVARFADTQTLTNDIAIRYAYMSLVVIVAWNASLAAFRTRDKRVLGVGASEYKAVINASSTTFGLLAIAFLVFQADTARWFFTVAFPLGLLGLLINRWLWRKWLITQRAYGHFLSRVVVAGKRADVETVVRQIRANSGAAYTVVGAVIEEDGTTTTSMLFEGLDVRDDLSLVTAHARELGVDGVVIAGQPSGGSQFIHDLAWQLEGHTLELILATSLANVAGPRIHFRPVDGLPLIHVEIPQFEGAKHAMKRALDIVLSGTALIALAPLFLVLYVLVRLDSPGPAFFSQERVGKGGETFRIYKFRSMVVQAEERLAELAALNEGSGVLFKMKDDPRVTNIGRVLRKYSLDELPQIWNVLLGDMSLVGPRPPLPQEVLGYDDHVHRRLFIKPGLTGMWQINGRSALSWEESVRLDLYYVENWSVVGDLLIMWRTVKVLVQPVGAY
jgi:exopolysaccharide biosynthesis polyprenyl glycosylphosphotransferase